MKFLLLGTFALILIATTFGKATNKCQEETVDLSTKGEGTYADEGKFQILNC